MTAIGRLRGSHIRQDLNALRNQWSVDSCRWSVAANKRSKNQIPQSEIMLTQRSKHTEQQQQHNLCCRLNACTQVETFRIHPAILQPSWMAFASILPCCYVYFVCMSTSYMRPPPFPFQPKYAWVLIGTQQTQWSVSGAMALSFAISPYQRKSSQQLRPIKQNVIRKIIAWKKELICTQSLKQQRRRFSKDKK